MCRGDLLADAICKPSGYRYASDGPTHFSRPLSMILKDEQLNVAGIHPLGF